MRKTLQFTGLAGLALAMLALPAGSQTNERRATFVRSDGERDGGRCTLQVSVDREAEVTVMGDRAVVRTLSGETSTIQAMECTGPIPHNMADFHMQSTAPEPRGLVGRLLGAETGRAQLVADPRSSDGRAVVRIDDPAPGFGVYTLELSWHGGSNYGLGDRDRDRDRDRGEDRDRRDASTVAFHDRGDGYFRHRDFSDRVVDCTVRITGDDVRTSFVTENGSHVDLIGRVRRSEGDRIVAD